MKFCSNCGKQLDDASIFCSDCGTKQEVAAPQQPQAESMDYSVPAPSVKGKVMGFVSLGLSAFGLFFSTITFFLSLVALDSWSEEPAILAITYAILFIVCPILGLVFSGIASNENNTTVFPKLGKIFGIIATILFGLSFILAVSSL